MLRDEIMEVLDLFDKYNISDENRRKLFSEGLYFDYTYGDPDPQGINQHLNFFGVGILLKTCLENDIKIDINQLLIQPYLFSDATLIKEIADAQNNQGIKPKTLG